MTGETLLYRQVNPSWVQAGRVTSQVFKPTLKDNKRLSVYDGDQITAEDSWNHYTSNLGFSSAGVVAVTVQECDSQQLPTESDPTPFPSHVVIRFDKCSTSEAEKSAKHLKRFAEERGWLCQVGGRG
jgi:hypothetical protein